MQEIKVDIKKYIDFLMVGEKATSYKCPLIVEEIKEFQNFLVFYTKQINGYCLAFEKESFMKAIDKYKGVNDG